MNDTRRITAYRIGGGEKGYIGLRLPEDPRVEAHLKRLPGIRRLREHGNYCCPDSYRNIGELLRHCKAKGIWFDLGALRHGTTGRSLPQRNTPGKASTTGRRSKPESSTSNISPQIDAKLVEFKAYLEQRRYAETTVATYLSLLRQFFGRLPTEQTWDALQNRDVIAYNHTYFIEAGKSYATQNQFLNALKLFCSFHGKTCIIPENLVRPRKANSLPEVMTKEEVARLLSSLNNLKHRTLLSLLYACGLRIGEALSLRRSDLREQECLLYVRGGKGRKDRAVPLNGKIIELLTRYCRAFPGEGLLFTGRYGEPYSYRSAQQAMKRAVRASGPRHSYATHLLQNGTDLRHIQTILGRTDSKTTMLYTHVVASDLRVIKSPFDEL